MDSQEVLERESERGGEGSRFLARCCFSVFFVIAVSFSLSFLFGLVALAIGSTSASPPVSVPANCRIISSSVDIRFSKVCELGLLNYKANNVFYPLERSRFRCRHDYYWASVFEVEYKEYFSGHLRHAIAESPKEALPVACRPSFGTAWLTKMKFKVNGTYSCRYSLGTGKADIYPDELFNCEAKEPSKIEMLRRFFILFMKLNFSADKAGSGREMAHLVAGLVSGMVIGMCFIILIKSLRILWLTVTRHWAARKLQIKVFAARFRRVCLLVAYISTMGWLTIQYSKMVGLKQLLFESNLKERTI
ncbi:uncharacterized protein LOC120279227 isoform X2 [Dioscorea cayenensis subsp. rotundata]|uniref:Uncharacterized protein LOC120279227 isoform X2 n=1 Tax=Dioscorea cayennensis subsp. rotundata TaxID=55577 RepID=A0AB40CPM0_DIOCR|nr:uncharacterized protein LOC120279227 isoform X2 [Dioscorea cayenensis subsp. rotundata]